MSRLLDTRTHKLAERIIRSAREPRDRIASNGHRRWLDELADGRKVLSFNTSDWDEAARAHAAGEFALAGVFHLWDRNRIIYAAHPLLVAELAHLTSTAIPGEIWTLIPHTEPLVVLPEGAALATPDGETGRLAGFFVHGRRHDGALCAIHDPARAAIGLIFLVELRNTTEFDIVRTTVDTSRPQTLEEMVIAGLARFDTTNGPPPTDQRWTSYLRALLGTAAAILLYTCSDDRDLGPMPAPDSRRPARRARSRGTRLALGWQLGPALHAARQQAREQTGAPTGRRQPPHQRGASLRTYWTGKGRRIPRLKFVKPYYVSLDLLDNPEEPPYRILRVE